MSHITMSMLMAGYGFASAITLQGGGMSAGMDIEMSPEEIKKYEANDIAVTDAQSAHLQSSGGAAQPKFMHSQSAGPIFISEGAAQPEDNKSRSDFFSQHIKPFPRQVHNKLVFPEEYAEQALTEAGEFCKSNNNLNVSPKGCVRLLLQPTSKDGDSHDVYISLIKTLKKKLLTAVHKVDANTVDNLLTSYFDVTEVNGRDETLMQLAKAKDVIEILEKHQQIKQLQKTLFNAVRRGSTLTVERYLTKSFQELNPLISQCTTDYFDVNEVDSAGQTLEQIATDRRQPKVIEILKQHQAAKRRIS